MNDFVSESYDTEERLVQSATIATAKESERERLIQEYKRRSEHSFAPSTRKSRAVMLRIFRKYCEEQGYSPEPPCSPFLIAKMIDDFAPRYKTGTIETMLSAIHELHRANFSASPRSHPIVQLAFRSAKRNYGTISRQAPPLCRSEILECVSKLGSSRIEVRDKAVLLVAADSWCRSAELAELRMHNMEIQSDGSAILSITRSKTDRFAKGGYAYLSMEAVQAVTEWQKLSQLRPVDPMFTTSYGNGCRKPLLSVTFTQIIRRVTGRRDVSSHSTRVGGVHDAMRIGCDMASIMVSGRWQSAEMPARYGSRFLVGQSAAAKVAARFRDCQEN
jgi:integrase